MQLSPEAIMGEEVVITMQAKGQRAAINQQLSSNAITNIVSSDKIREVPDVNAAESIGRLPGVSLRRSGGEGNQVVVRGLSPQYTIVEVDGVRLQGVGLGRDVGTKFHIYRDARWHRIIKKPLLRIRTLMPSVVS